MWPALRTGDEAGYVPQPRLPSPGEVVIARISGALVAHRVVRAEAGRLVLRGDSCRADDPAISPEAVLGVVRAVRRRGRVLPERAWGRGPRWLGALKVRLGGRLRRVLGRAA